MKAKNQRLTLVGLAILALLGAGGLALSTLGGTATYFYSPADVAAKGINPGEAVRLGGMVEAGSLRKADSTITFRVSDGANSVPVRFTGILPDLFREGQGMIADGRFEADGVFVADNILAKHDENYKPPEHAGGQHKVAGKVA